MTQVANLPVIVDTGGKLPPVSMTPAANLPPELLIVIVHRTQWICLEISPLFCPLSMFTYNYLTNLCFLDLRVPLVLVCCCRHFLRPFSPLQVRCTRSYQKSSMLMSLADTFYQFYSLHSLLSYVLQFFVLWDLIK